MVVEWLKFQVEEELREQFIQQDEAIWTKALSNYPGFIGKEVWIDPDTPEKVVFVIRWQTREQWKSIPRKDLLAVEQDFSQVMEKLKIKYMMTESKEFQIRKFPSK